MNLWKLSCALTVTASAGLAMASQSSLKLNEIYVNPPSGDTDVDDAQWEYIEIFGCPNTSLAGLAIVIINDEGTTEIDESFYFPTTGTTYQTNSDGVFVLWNSLSDGSLSDQATGSFFDSNFNFHYNSEVYQALPSTVTAGGNSLGLSDTVRFEASFNEVQNVPAGEEAAKIANDGSMTFFLLDLANDADLFPSDVEKDAEPSSDEQNLDTPSSWSGAIVIDEIAYSDSGGSEYTFDEGNEFDFSPGFNPDALSRVNDEVFSVDATRELTADGESCEEFRQAYTNWVAGDIDEPGDNQFDEGFGGIPRPAANTCTDLGGDIEDFGWDISATDLNGSGANGDGDANYDLTPGAANEGIHDGSPFAYVDQSDVGTSCSITLDFNLDGAVTFDDVIHAAQKGDFDAAVRVIHAIR